MKKWNYGLMWSAALIIWFLPGCKKIPNNGVPVYLEMDSVSVIIDDSVHQGSASQKISDVWVEAGNSDLGAYEYPVQVPVLKDGNIAFLISPGIRNNGASGYRKIYPFLNPDTFTLANAVPGTTYKHHCNFHYKSGAQFHIEDFDGAVNSYTNITPQSFDVFEGGKSGMLTLSSLDTFKYAYQTIPVAIPGGQAVYVEMNYKCDIPFTMGVISNVNGAKQNIDKITFNPKSGWNKTYVDFSYEIGATATASGTTYQFYFTAEKSQGSAANIYFDNIKILHF
ncbi:MAG: hypothetical protein U0T73_13705 [Chitinophagales bacterium]